MTNAELIEALRNCSSAEGTCAECLYRSRVYPGTCNGCKWDMMHDAAEALEAAEKRIADLEADKKTLINVVKDKSDFHATKDAMRIAELEKQLPKEGHWIPNSPFTGNCSKCGDDGNLKDKYCSNCGARMRGTKGEPLR